MISPATLFLRLYDFINGIVFPVNTNSIPSSATTIAMARGHATVLSIGLLCTLFNYICALDVGADFFENQQQQPQVCQVYTLIESPVVIETLVPSNTVLHHSACDCEITITNAPTLLKTTITITSILGKNAFSTPYRNPRYPVITSRPNNLNIPTSYISITDTSDQKRQLNGVKYLKGDGTLTNNTSDAVQIYESDGQLFTIKGAPDGTYYTDVNVESIIFASQPHTSLTPNSIAGSFSVGSTLVWEHPLFVNSQAIFALTPQGLVKAIFNGKIPPGVKRIGLILTRVDNSHTTSSTTEGSSTGGNTIATASSTLQETPVTTRGPLNGLPGLKTYRSSSTNYPSPVEEETSTFQPNNNNAISKTRIKSSADSISPSTTEVTPTNPASQTSETSFKVQATTTGPTCTTFIDNSDGGLPITLGLATLASPPNWPFSYANHNSTFDVTFGPSTTPGSLAYAQLNPSIIPTDSILYYQLNSTVPNTTSICQTWGYLYHQQSGLCLTALVNGASSTSAAVFQGSYIALEPCKICDSKSGFPESDQLFCAVQEDGTLGKWFCIGFMGDDVQGLGYGILYQEGVVDAVLEEGGGDCIYVAAR
ncbi:hypothetical protein N431DRAFT_540242 [Stipitochalara longipes BDJ]|nr:hypothetical protein N431DRAFT_540242 [Stipitochalara longipes BDJ]